MSNLPDFSPYNYQVESELGHNRVGGRVTYKATSTPPIRPNQGGDKKGVQVVIKQFQFAQFGASWTEYDAYEREIEVLRNLNHPGIPHYLDSFETPAGFCLVQEYKDAPSLATSRRFTPQDIKQIALSILKILVYLQSQTPAVIHRDIKPENILVGSIWPAKVYLVDFGFARVGGGEVAVSSVVKGTLGFMPPEQLFNRQLTEASDLYGLGATLICLLTGTPSAEIGKLMDADYRINFKDFVPQQLNPRFLDWLQKMVAPNLKDRYANAAEALEALKPIDVHGHDKKRSPSVKTLLLTTVSLGLLTFSGYLFHSFFLKDRSLTAFNPELVKSQIEPFHWELFTTGLTKDYTPVNAVEEISMNQKQVYFYLRLSLPSNQYNGGCKIFDGSGTVVYEGQSTLVAEDNKLDTWCVYNFNKAVDKPGDWTFEFSLDNRTLVTKKLKVFSYENRE